MQELFRKREADFDTVQGGMRTIEEFQKTKAQMEQELEDVRLSALFRNLLQEVQAHRVMSALLSAGERTHAAG